MKDQLGLEKTPEEYVQKMVEVFREVWRALRDDGTVWLNIGSSMAGSGGAHKKHHANPGISNSFKRNGVPRWEEFGQPGNYLAPKGYKPKDLIPIPWMVAMALQNDGWYLRQDIIWNKPNPMPESVTDRPTKSHEYIFLLSKNQRYFYDAEAVKEPLSAATIERGYTAAKLKNHGTPKEHSNISKYVRQGKGFWDNPYIPKSRNRRSVWTVSTRPYPGAHFATFPPDLIKPCIKAGCPQNGTVLDPFMGAGTTGLVAQELGRSWIGIELNNKYCELVKRRIPREYQQNLLELC